MNAGLARATARKQHCPPAMEGIQCAKKNCTSRRSPWLRVAIVAFFLMGLSARGAGFSAGLENDTVYPGEQARLTLTFQDGSPSAAPSLPAIPGLQISYLGESRQFSFNNGRSASSVTHSYGVSAPSLGEARGRAERSSSR